MLWSALMALWILNKFGKNNFAALSETLSGKIGVMTNILQKIYELLHLEHSSDEMVFAADIKNTDAVLSFLEKDMTQKNIISEKRANIIIAAEEIFSNIAQYAYPPGSGIARIKTQIKDSAYIIQFADNGIAYNPLDKNDPDVTQSAEERNIGGLGIFLVKKMTDNITYKRQDGQNILTISVNI